MSLNPADPDLYIKVDFTGMDAREVDQLCAILRGLFYSNGNSNGQGLKNGAFKSGKIVSFGAGTKKIEFVNSLQRFLNHEIIDRITINDD